MLVKDASELVGNTPLVEVSRFAKTYDVKARVCGPDGSNF